MIFIGILSSIFATNTITLLDFLKDLLRYTATPVIVLLAYIFSSNIAKSEIYSFVIFMGRVSALMHFILFAYGLVIGDVELPLLFGFGFLGHVEFAALLLSYNQKKRSVWTLLIVGSILLYSSRTLLGGLALYLLFVRRKGKHRIFGLISTAVVVLAFGLFVLNDVSLTGKIVRIPTEMLSTDYSGADKSAINEGWRSYEVYRVFESYRLNGTGLKYLIGNGLGSKIELGFSQVLKGKEYDEIIKIHNSVAEVFFKTGAVGILALLYWLVHLFRAAKTAGMIALVLFLYFFLCQLVIMGLWSSELGVVVMILFSIIPRSRNNFDYDKDLQLH